MFRIFQKMYEHFFNCALILLSVIQIVNMKTLLKIGQFNANKSMFFEKQETELAIQKFM